MLDKPGFIDISLPETFLDDDDRPIGLCPVPLLLPNEEWPNWRFDPEYPELIAIDWHIFKCDPRLERPTRWYWRTRTRILNYLRRRREQT